MFTLAVCSPEEVTRLRAANADIAPDMWENIGPYEYTQGTGNIGPLTGLIQRLSYPADRMHVLLVTLPEARINSVHRTNFHSILPFHQALMHGARYAYAVQHGRLLQLKDADGVGNLVGAPGVRFPFLGPAPRPANQEKAIETLRLLIDEAAEKLRSVPKLYTIVANYGALSGLMVVMMTAKGPMNLASLISEAIPHIEVSNHWITNVVNMPFLVCDAVTFNLQRELAEVGLETAVEYLPVMSPWF